MGTFANHPNVIAYKRMIAAFNANDFGAVEALVAPDLEYTMPGRMWSDASSLAGERAGKIVEGRTVPVDLSAFDEFWS